MKESLKFSSICKKKAWATKDDAEKTSGIEIKKIRIKKEDAIDTENWRGALADAEIYDDGMNYFAHCIKINQPPRSSGMTELFRAS